MVYLRLVAFIAAAAILVACGDAEPAPEAPDAIATLEPSPISPPAATPTPIPTLPVPKTTLASSGWAVGIVDDRLSAVSLSDGRATPLTMASGRGNSSYAGHAVADGELLAFAVEARKTGEDLARASLVETSLPDGSQRVLFEFDFSASFYPNSSIGNIAAVSSDAMQIAYGDVDGLQVFDVESASSRLLAIDACPRGQQVERCTSFSSPEWSPDGTMLMVTKNLYEGSTLLIADVSSGTTRNLTAIGGLFKAWSPGGRYICAPNGTYGTFGAFVLTPDGAVVSDIPDTGLPGRVAGCYWLPDGRLLLTYWVGKVPPPLSLWLSVREYPSLIASVPDTEVRLPSPWMVGPGFDATDVLVSFMAACLPGPCGERLPNAGLLTIGGEFEDLPVQDPVAVIPAMP